MKKLIFLAVVLLLAAPAGFADIYFQPQSSTGGVGDTFVVDVMYSGAVSPWLGGYDIDIGYNPGVVHAFMVAWPDDFLGFSMRDALPGTGIMNVSEVSLASVADLGTAQSGHDPFRLFQLGFTGVAPGVSALTFDRVELSDGEAHFLAPGNTPSGDITVTGAVPEPSAVVLFLLPVLTTLGMLRRRR